MLWNTESSTITLQGKPKTHKKKHRKRQSSRHQDKERDSRRSKKSRRHRSVSSSSSSSDSTERSHSASASSSGSDNDVQIVESPPGPSKSSRASSVSKRESRSPSLSKRTSRGSKSPSQSKRSSRGSRSPSQSKRGSRASSVISVDTSDTGHKMPRIPEENANEFHSGGLGQLPPLPLQHQHEKPLVDISGDDVEKKEEKKPLFNHASSAAMAKIALGLRAKVHALLEKESKI
ncbi:unnamed protein product [Meganyctiphanes norvegica]|uniref:Uncharacterized protein n=1 Tax=Meganyctiphanes norvegica TaxID=48144 RepID=A0AAV2Q9C8_MEGNR